MHVSGMSQSTQACGLGPLPNCGPLSTSFNFGLAREFCSLVDHCLQSAKFDLNLQHQQSELTILGTACSALPPEVSVIFYKLPGTPKSPVRVL